MVAAARAAAKAGKEQKSKVPADMSLLAYNLYKGAWLACLGLVYTFIFYFVSDCSPSFVCRSGTGGGAEGLKTYGKGMYFVQQ